LSEELLKRAPLPGLAGGGAFFRVGPAWAQSNGWKSGVQVAHSQEQGVSTAKWNLKEAGGKLL